MWAFLLLEGTQYPTFDCYIKPKFLCRWPLADIKVLLFLHSSLAPLISNPMTELAITTKKSVGCIHRLVSVQKDDLLSSSTILQQT